MTMSAVDERSDIFDRAGLPRDGIAAWQVNDDAVSGDYLRDAEDFSRQWRIGAELLAKLPAKPARSAAQVSAAAAILQRDRAAREDFLRAHAETVYRRLTHDFTKFVRVEQLVRDAAVLLPGLVPDDKLWRTKMACRRGTRTAPK